jgi:hypothetical protein
MKSRTKILLAGLLSIAVAALADLSLAGCGGRSWLEDHPSGTGTGTGGAGGAVGYGGLPPGKAPTPHCKGKNSQCIVPDGGGPVMGAASIVCDPEPIKGPWNLLLERKILNQFQVVQVQAVEEPGFGAKFLDTSGPPAELTYRVCVTDGYGERCSDPFQTYGAVDCVCLPSTCGVLVACDVSTNNGCGGTLVCGDCSDGTPCNPKNNSCCPSGEDSDGAGGCVCAPPKPCHGGTYWNTTTCSCELANDRPIKLGP